MKVYILTNPELGWDCVCGVSLSIQGLYNNWIEGDDEQPKLTNEKEIRKYFDDCWVILHEQNLIE